MDETTWQERFAQVLDTVERVGSVSTGKKLTYFFPPKLKVQGLDDEHVAFPLLQRQATQLRDLAEPSPFGKGSETLVDRSVRKSWQIDASRVTVGGGSNWSTTLNKVVRDCCDDLGVDPAVQPYVQPQLYKLLLYETGDFFKPHQDSEKEIGMFGTLTLQLPSLFEGGALVMRHKGQKQFYDFSGQDSEETCFCTAFYGDCEHEILPVTSGWRLCLIYNLVVVPTTSNSVQPSAALALGDIEELRSLAETWSDCCSHDMQGYLLEHDYTETNFDMLKGRDKQVVNLLRAVKDDHGKPLFDVYVLLLEKHDNGQPDYDDPGVMGEICETEISNYSVHRMNEDDSEDEDEMKDNIHGSFDPNSHMLRDCEISEEFPDDPDHKEYEGYQGNWGPTLQYWYYKGVVVFRPRKDGCSSPPYKKVRSSTGGADDPIVIP